MTIQEEIKAAGLPEHIAIIMDGNGRWAQQRGLDRLYGHKAGVDTVKRVVEAAGEIGLRYLTLYTFSIENWHRPKEEVDALMGLMADAIVRETPELMRQGVRIKVIGHTTDLPAEVWQKMEGLVEQTAGNRGVTLILAFSCFGSVLIRSSIFSKNFGLILKKMIYIWPSVITNIANGVLA